MHPFRLVYINTSLNPQDYNPRIAKTCLRFRTRPRIRLMNRALSAELRRAGTAHRESTLGPASRLVQSGGQCPPDTKEARWRAMAASHGSRLRTEARGAGGRLAAPRLVAQFGGQFILLGGDRVGQLLVERTAHLIVRPQRFL